MLVWTKPLWISSPPFIQIEYKKIADFSSHAMTCYIFQKIWYIL